MDFGGHEGKRLDCTPPKNAIFRQEFATLFRNIGEDDLILGEDRPVVRLKGRDVTFWIDRQKIATIFGLLLAVDAEKFIGKPYLDERDMVGQAAGGGIIEEVHTWLLVGTHPDIVVRRLGLEC
jgi:hypothetical protein